MQEDPAGVRRALAGPVRESMTMSKQPIPEDIQSGEARALWREIRRVGDVQAEIQADVRGLFRMAQSAADRDADQAMLIAKIQTARAIGLVGGGSGLIGAVAALIAAFSGHGCVPQ